MPRLQPVTFRREDFPDLQGQDQLDRFFRLLNSFTTQVVGTVNGYLSITDNVRAFSKTLDVSVSWITPALAGSWAALGGIYATPAYHKNAAGEVRIKGTVKSGTGLIFTLPVGCRPLQAQVFVQDGNDAFAEVVVNADGTVALNTGTGTTALTLNGISFFAEDVPQPTTLVAFKNTLSSRPLGIVVVGATETQAPKPAVALGPVAWTTSGDQIVVSGIAGMVPGRKYTVTLLVLGS